MPVNTASAAVHITPVALKTFYRHAKRKGQKLKRGDTTDEATDDILFDEAFHIVKAFIKLGTYNTVESLQGFTNTHVPAPYWAAVFPLQIPFSSCNKAADVLIDWFGPGDLRLVVGGERWWQVRGLDGIDSEWITEKEYLSEAKLPLAQKHSQETDIQRMEHLNSVMLYVHGGAYFWGSINTHRYQLIRYARKMKGRVFAVNYRKAPQYPWPCPLHDVISAYFYLTSPPPGAPHKAVPPSKLVFAGDSAGAGLCITALTVLRDMGYSQPAGAVLISPWVDLTHSFPSVMKNTATDIMPPHGFIHKPSPLWPVDTVPADGRARALPPRTNPPPRPGHADTLRPSGARLGDQVQMRVEKGVQERRPIHTAELKDENVGSQEEMLRNAPPDGEDEGFVPANSPSQDVDRVLGGHTRSIYDTALDFWEPKPPKVFMKDPKAMPLELHSQIQIYATTEQLTHPLVSPIIQGSLGNLCPLYIMAGDGELLRDEIIYLAHKAANPKEYPARNGVLKEGRRQRENAEKFQAPTNVRLQVFDGMCHVLTVFTFIDSAKYAYDSIAQFVQHVTAHTPEYLDHNPFSEPTAKEGAGNQPKEYVPMIRERVDVFGRVRSMEPKEDIEALQVPLGEVGLIKEEPVERWLAGQELWDKKFKRRAARVERKRKKYEAKAARLVEHARQQGLVLENDQRPPPSRRGSSETAASLNSADDYKHERRWGPLDLEGERPSLSAIAGRRDTREAVALIKKMVYHSAPLTHNTVPKLRTSDAIRAAFDPEDHPTKAPRQSVSEQQTYARAAPLHGLRMWQSLVAYFMRRSTRKAADGKDRAVDKLRTASEKIGVTDSNE